MWERRLDHEERAAKADVEDQIPVGRTERLDLAEAADARGGHDDVDPAQAVRRRSHRRIDRSLVAHVAGETERPHSREAATCLANDAGNRLRRG